MDDQPTYQPEEFFPTFNQFPKVGQVVICGGQAVNLLATIFLSREKIKCILGESGTTTSNDMDIMITEDLQKEIIFMDIKSRPFGLMGFKDTRQPIKFVILPKEMPNTRIDVLRAIRGVHTEKDKIFEKSLNLENGDYNVINPVTLLIAKAENCATLQQNSPEGKRNDAIHTKLMVPIVHNYLKKLVTNCNPKSKQGQREIIGFLKSLHEASKNTNFKNGMKIAGTNFYDAVPIKPILKSKLETLKSYLMQTFMGNPPPGC